ncbi:hypothetical protein [Burkholderia sp. F1]|uniref:hypothetical protein n=1 Tax=Burkholderia sp. F1 TaxID=3366817 RepID=UPI003D7108C5
MKLELMKCKCSACGNDFLAPSLGDGAYGEFLLWSENGKVVYLNAFEDQTFKEVDNLLCLHSKTSALDSLDRAKILHKIYGKLACDRDESGSIFSIEASPPCPVCGSQAIASWESINPAEVVDLELSNVTHFYWNSLTFDEKGKMVDMELSGL